MSKNPGYVEAFNKKLAELSKNNGCKYDIVCKDLNAHLIDNCLSPCWFRPGTIIAQSDTEKGTIVFEIMGGLDAEIRDSSGKTVQTFSECLAPFGSSLLDDNDLKELINGTHSSGGSMKIRMGNAVCAYLKDSAMTPVEINKASVASAILDPNAIDLVYAEAAKTKPTEKKIELPPEEFFPDNESDAKADEKAKALEECMKTFEESASDVPEKKTKTTKKKMETKMDKDTKAKAAEPEEKAAESAKKVKATAVEKKVEKKAAKGRCDLLPLDVVADFLTAKIEKKDDPFSLIREFTETGDPEKLIRAAKAFSGEHYDCEETALLELAVLMEEDAEENGEGAWKNASDVKEFVNSGIRHLLLCSRGDKDMMHDRGFIQSMLCGAWICKCCPNKNNYL